MDPGAAPLTSAPAVPFREAARTWARVGLNSFGGPAGQIAVMHRILVEEKRWIDEERFLHALNFCMLLPGPEAQQLATYIGWLLNGVRGGLVAGTLFVLPGFVAILGLSILDMTLHDTVLLRGLLFGLKPAVLAVVLEAVLRIGRRALTDRLRLVLAAGAFAALFFLSVPFPVVVAAAAAIGFVMVRPGDASTRHADEGARGTRPAVRRALLIAGAGLGACPRNSNGRVRDAVGPDARRRDEGDAGHRRGAATKQMAPRRPNPKGTGCLRPYAALLVVTDGPTSPPPRALPPAASTLCAAIAISRTGS